MAHISSTSLILSEHFCCAVFFFAFMADVNRKMKVLAKEEICFFFIQEKKKNSIVQKKVPSMKAKWMIEE